MFLDCWSRVGWNTQVVQVVHVCLWDCTRNEGFRLDCSGSVPLCGQHGPFYYTAFGERERERESRAEPTETIEKSPAGGDSNRPDDRVWPGLGLELMTRIEREPGQGSFANFPALTAYATSCRPDDEEPFRPLSTFREKKPPFHKRFRERSVQHVP